MLTRQEWCKAGLCLLLFWAAAAFWLAPRLRQKLENAATTLVAKLEKSTSGARFDRVRVTADGQNLHIEGAVRSEADARLLHGELSENLRTEGSSVNPVTAVRSADTLQIRPLDSGWLAAAVRGFDLDIIGVCASERERDALEESLRRRWPVWRGRLTFAIQVDGRRFDESPAWPATVRTLPAPEARGVRSARLLAARIGKSWTPVSLDADSASAPEEVRHLNLTTAEWSDRLRPAHDAVLAHQREEAAWEAEQERLRSLPPAHVFLGLRGDQVLLRGEVFDLAAKRAAIAAVMAALPGRRVLDDIRASGQRRPAPGFGALDAGGLLGGKDGKAFTLALPGKAWSTLDWEVGRDSQPWQELLPEDLQASLVREDGALVIDWLQGSNAGIPLLPPPPQSPFLTLAMQNRQITLGGRLAEESLRAQLAAAVKRMLPSGWTFRDEVVVSGACAASESVHHLALSIPAPPADAVLFAAATPGDAWHVLPPAMVASLALQPAGETVHGIPSQALAQTFAAALEEARAQGLRFPGDESRVIDSQAEQP